MRVLIPDGESGHSLAVAQSLLENNEVAIYLMATIKHPASKFLTRCKAFKWIEKTNEKSYLDSVIKFGLEQKVDIILPVDENTGKIFSKNKEYIEKFIPIIPLPKIETFNLATNKRLLAEFCITNGIPTPNTWSLPEFTKEIEDTNAQLFPVIIKPESGNGGKNIRLIKTKEDFLKIEFSTQNKEFGNYFVQEFIEGYDIDMSVLCIHGKIEAFTIQRALLGRKSNFAAAAGIEFLDNIELKGVVEKIIHELKYSGIAHLDLRFDNKTNEFKIIEINSRFWGSLLGSTKAGVNFPYLSCKAGLNRKFKIPAFKKNRYFDFFNLLKNPYSFKVFNIKLKETNSNFIFSGFLSNVINFYQRT